MRIPQYPTHAKTSRQVPPSHYGLAPPGLPDGPDVPGGSRWPRVSGACTGAQAASSKYSQRMSLASLCPAQTSPLGWRSRRRLPLPASLPLPPLLNCRKQLELGHGLFRRPCSPWTRRLTTFVVVISSWDLMVTSTGSRACESKPHKVGNVRASEQSGDDSPIWGSCEFPGGVNSPPRVLPSTNNGLVSTRGARRALLPHLIAHSGAGFAFSQKEDFRRSMSSWLARAADLLARVAMNRLRLAFCSRASDLAIYGGLTLDAYCGRRRRSDPVPFFFNWAGRKCNQ